MIGKKLLASKPITLAEVKDYLKDRSEQSELTYEQNLTNEYVKKFAKLAKTKAAKLLEELKAIEGMNEELAVKVVDLMPQSLDILRLVVPKGVKVSDEGLQAVLKAVKSAE
jgi:DNA-directed RNA polymerase subunit F